MFSYGKQIAGLAIGLSLLGSGAAEATVPQDALVVSGIEYGAPREVETKFDPAYVGGQGVEWEYGSEFDIVFVNNVVRRVEIGARNGIQTKDGIAVGTDVNALIAAYGQPDAMRGDQYIYYAEGDAAIGFMFEIENGRVDEIKMGMIR